MDRHLLVRAVSLYIVLLLTAAVWIWRRPTRRDVTGAGLALLWNVPVVLGLHTIATGAGWWQFDADGGVLLGMPVELWLAWAWLWGAIPALACPSLNPIAVACLALSVDLILMPAAVPVLRLGPAWLVGEALGLIIGLVPAQLLARWTVRDERLVARAVLQMIAFTGILLFVIPAIAIEGSGGTWSNPFEWPLWQLSLIVQILAVPAVLGLSAVQEFVTRGRGTPIPYDPPQRLVVTGVYAYVRNPMQLSAVVLLVIVGVVVGNLWVSAAGVMAHLYSAGLAGWDEDEDLTRRFGPAWIEYRTAVRSWRPRVRPVYPAGHISRLFVAEGCGMCRQVGAWFERRGPRGLTIVPAETHRSGALVRITYEDADGYSASGVAAVARALEHIHLGWAMMGFVLRMPAIGQVVQLVVDASGGGPRRIAPACDI